MNNFILDELLADEYRKDRLTEAKRHNLAAQFNKKSYNLHLYKYLAMLGKRIENMGAKVQAHYNCLAMREKRSALASIAK